MYILSSEKSTILNNESSHLQQLLFPCEKRYFDCLLKNITGLILIYALYTSIKNIIIMLINCL